MTVGITATKFTILYFDNSYFKNTSLQQSNKYFRTDTKTDQTRKIANMVAIWKHFCASSPVRKGQLTRNLEGSNWTTCRSKIALIIPIGYYKMADHKIVFYCRRKWTVFNRKHKVITDGVIMLRASHQMLCNVWSYHILTGRLVQPPPN